MRPLSWSAYIVGASSLVAFLVVCGARPPSYIALAAFALGGLLRGRIPAKPGGTPWPQLALFLACMAFAWLGEDALVQGSGYVSFLSARVSLALVMALGLLPLFSYNTRLERGYCGAAIVGLMIALVTYSTDVLSLGPAVILQLTALAYYMREQIPGARPSLAALATLLPTLGLAFLITLALRWSETQVNFIFSLLTPPAGMSFSFPDKTRLESMARADKNPWVALRYYSARPSTHLVARCYASYSGGSWSNPQPPRPVSGTVSGDNYRYELTASPGPGKLEDEEIELSGPAPDRILPRDAQVLFLNAPSVERLPGDTYALVKGAEERNYRFQRLPDVYPGDLNPVERQPWLEVPDALQPTLKKLAAEWAGDALPLGPSADQRARLCRRLENYFQDHFTYGFGYPFSESKEPILSFLTDRPAAHCELFASSLALMLRCYGIPTRYVNGYLVKEHSTLGGYSIVRGRHAHAWVEALIAGQGWLVLDPTPPLYTQTDEDLSVRMQALSDFFFHLWSRFTQMSWEELARLFLALLRRWALPALAVGLLWQGWKRRKSLGWRSRASLSAKLVTRRAQGELLDQVEAALRPLGWIRPPGTTLLDWGVDKEGPLGAFLIDYCCVLYGQDEADVDDLARLSGLRDQVVAWAAQEAARALTTQ